MASIVREPNGRKRIDVFIGSVRRKVRLGKVPQKVADTYKVRIDSLASCALYSIYPDQETCQWLGQLDAKMIGRLERAGLLPKGVRKPLRTLGAFLDELFSTLKVKKSTVTAYRMTEANLVAFFTREKALNDIGPLDGDQFAKWMRESEEARLNKKKDKLTLATATVTRRTRVARQMFDVALTWELIRKNPFAHLKGGSESNSSRLFFVTREMTDKLIGAAPDVQWKLVIALCRYGGFRCPSEHVALRWDDVLWDLNRIRVRASKNERHQGGGIRIIPIFPELHQLLLDARDLAKEGEEFVITRYRSPLQNLRTTFLKIIGRAGLEPWPRLMQNMRSSRETELVENFPIQVACAWIGNSEKVAKKHYLQVTDAHFEAAAWKAEHKAARSAEDSYGQDRTNDMEDCKNADESSVLSNGGGFSLVPASSVQTPETPENDARRLKRGAISGAPDPRDSLPDHIRMRNAQRLVRKAFRILSRRERPKLAPSLPPESRP